MTSIPSEVPMPRTSRPNDLGFDPEVDYAQVLEEARKHIQEVSLESKGGNSSLHHQSRTFRRPDLVADISCFAAHFKAAEVQNSLEDLGTRKSWKNSLLFWKKSHKKYKIPYSYIPTPQHPGFKSRSKPTSGPIYTNIDVQITASCRSSRSISGSVFSTTVAATKDETEIPYMSLSHQKHGGGRSAKPIYLVT